MVQSRRRLRKLYIKHEKTQQRIDARRDKLRHKIEAFQRAKDARLKTTRDKCTRLERDREILERERDAAFTKDRYGALVASKTKKLVKLDDKLSKLRAELEEAETGFGGPENAKLYEIELAIEGLDMEDRKFATTTEKARAKEIDADIEDDEDDVESEDEEVSEAADDNDEEFDENDDVSESEEVESDDEEAPETEMSKVTSAAPTDTPTASFLDIEMPDMIIEDYRKTAVKIVDQQLEKRAIGDTDDSKL